jgi:flagellar basal-body rod protein FlgF
MDKMIFTSLNSIRNLYDERYNISQNMANISVPGYRRDLQNQGNAAFLSQYEALGPRAYALEVGPSEFSKKIGTMKRTEVPTDIGIANHGFIVAQSESGETIFTRRGDLMISKDGILQNGEGETILSENLAPIEVPQYSEIKISREGEIYVDSVQTPKGVFTSLGVIATIDPELYNLRKDLDGKIKHYGDNEVVPDQSGVFIQGSLELSNVNPVEEMVASIDNQRQFELNLKMIKSVEEADRSGMALLKISQ